MAKKRMLDKDLMQADLFVDLEPEERLLFVYLCLNADDDGFVGNPKAIARLAALNTKSVEPLEKAGFVKRFDSGVLVVREWWMHNYLKPDRYKPTIYQEEKQALSFDGARYVDFTEALGPVPNLPNPQSRAMEPEWNQDGTKMEAQYNLDESRKEESKKKEREYSVAQNQQNQAESPAGESENPRFAKLIYFLESIIGKTITEKQTKQLKQWYEDKKIGYDVLIKAMEVTEESKGKSFTYFSNAVKNQLKYTPTNFMKKYNPNDLSNPNEDIIMDFYSYYFIHREPTEDERDTISECIDEYGEDEVYWTILQMNKNDVGGNGLAYLCETLSHREGDRIKEEYEE